eukprot:TRINITY_DN1131_c1_g1_i1.p1 TRINITY_DN1131_c1_g1~~TRINITY_DN1131_c1_g1_i1.p1  ORF type:complete len:115 (-),score=49.26 TRINITY_DN1131_c1_g1_i1:169-513(-)
MSTNEVQQSSQNKLETLNIQINQTENISKVEKLLGSILKIEIIDGRIFIGKLYCFDKLQNIILQDCSELKKEKRNIGLLLIAWKNIVSCQIASSPSPFQQSDVEKIVERQLLIS